MVVKMAPTILIWDMFCPQHLMVPGVLSRIQEKQKMLNPISCKYSEENTQSTSQQEQMASVFYKLDPYRHNVVIHTCVDTSMH